MRLNCEGSATSSRWVRDTRDHFATILRGILSHKIFEHVQNFRYYFAPLGDTCEEITNHWRLFRDYFASNSRCLSPVVAKQSQSSEIGALGSGHFLGVQSFEFQYLLGVSEKVNIFGGMMILWIFFGGSSQNWTIFRGHFYAFFFLRPRYIMGDIFGGCYNFNYFVVLEIPDIFGVNGRCWTRAYVWRKTESTAPGLTPWLIFSTATYAVESYLAVSFAYPQYSKTCLEGPLKIDKTKILITDGSLMEVESITECSTWSILQYF